MKDVSKATELGELIKYGKIVKNGTEITENIIRYVNSFGPNEHMNPYWDAQTWLSQHFRPRAIRKDYSNFYLTLFDDELTALKMYIFGYFVANEMEIINIEKRITNTYIKLYRKIFSGMDTVDTTFNFYELDGTSVDSEKEIHTEAQNDIDEFVEKYTKMAIIDWILVELLMQDITQEFTKTQTSHRIASALKSEAVMNMVYTIYKHWNPRLVMHQHGNYKYVKATVMEPEMKDKLLHDAIKYTGAGKSELRYRYNTLVTYFYTSETYMDTPVETLLFNKYIHGTDVSMVTDELRNINEDISIKNGSYDRVRGISMGIYFLEKLIQLDRPFLATIYNFYKINDIPEQKETVCD